MNWRVLSILLPVLLASAPAFGIGQNLERVEILGFTKKWVEFRMQNGRVLRVARSKVPDSLDLRPGAWVHVNVSRHR